MSENWEYSRAAWSHLGDSLKYTISTYLICWGAGWLPKDAINSHLAMLGLLSAMDKDQWQREAKYAQLKKILGVDQ